MDNGLDSQIQPLLKVRNVSLAYEGRQVVGSVSFDLHQGENLCLVGSNGSGKSTLLKGILGLMPITSGSIEFIHGKHTAGYLAQISTTDRDFPATVWEIVLSGTQRTGRRLPFYTKDDRRRAHDALAKLKIENLEKSPIGKLSGGQQQRVLLARALVSDPEILVLDEPCSALDPEITAELYDLFDQLRQDLGLSILISTHDWEYVKRSADRVMELDNGVRYIGPVEHWVCEHEREG